MGNKTNVISVRVTDEQYRMLTEWQKAMEEETGIDIPLGALVRRLLDGALAQIAAAGQTEGMPRMGGRRPEDFQGADPGPRDRAPTVEDRKHHAKDFLEKYNE